MTDHLSPALLNAVADGELSADQFATANQHLAGCSSCTASALQQSLLKSATARAGQRYAMPPELGKRLASQAETPGTASSKSGIWSPGWITAAALLIRRSTSLSRAEAMVEPGNLRSCRAAKGGSPMASIRRNTISAQTVEEA